MRIIFAGGGSGGHFYPLIAVERALRDIASEQKLQDLDIIYAADDPYDLNLLKEDRIRYLKVPAGKIRRYFSIKNFFDPLKTAWGIIKASWLLYLNLPDVVFSKGGYASFPLLFAARLLGVPVIIHETDSIPGRVNKWAAKFAKRIAVSYPESMKINEAIVDILKDLLEFCQIIHQTGVANINTVKERMSVSLEASKFAFRYHPFTFLDEEKYKNAYKATSLIIARSGGSIFEIAAMGVPSILIPLPSSAQDHQRENAYAYARTGAAEVIEEANMTPHILLREIKLLIADKPRLAKMSEAAKSFAKPDAAQRIASEIIRLGLAH